MTDARVEQVSPDVAAREILRQAIYRANTPRGEVGWVSNAYEILERDITAALDAVRERDEARAEGERIRANLRAEAAILAQAAIQRAERAEARIAEMEAALTEAVSRIDSAVYHYAAEEGELSAMSALVETSERAKRLLSPPSPREGGNG